MSVFRYRCFNNVSMVFLDLNFNLCILVVLPRRKGGILLFIIICLDLQLKTSSCLHQRQHNSLSFPSVVLCALSAAIRTPFPAASQKVKSAVPTGASTPLFIHYANMPAGRVFTVIHSNENSPPKV